MYTVKVCLLQYIATKHQTAFRFLSNAAHLSCGSKIALGGGFRRTHEPFNGCEHASLVDVAHDSLRMRMTRDTILDTAQHIVITKYSARVVLPLTVALGAAPGPLAAPAAQRRWGRPTRIPPGPPAAAAASCRPCCRLRRRTIGVEAVADACLKPGMTTNRRPA